MKVVRPNCRWQFTAADSEFLLSALGRQPNDSQTLESLFADPGSRDAILDLDQVHQAMLESPACLPVSPHLYFYVLVRRALQRAGLTDRALADYTAEVLAEFTQVARTHATPDGGPQPFDYFVDHLETLQKCDDRGGFELRAHMGNMALFQAGLFRDRIEHRAARKGFPGLSYYEQIGESSFRIASHHPLANRMGIQGVLRQLAACFHRLRIVLNDLADRIFSWGMEDAQMQPLLVRIPAD